LSARHHSVSIEALRRQIRRLEGIGRAGGGDVLPLGISAIDTALPEGGLAAGALHDMQGEAGPLLGLTALLLGRAAESGRPVLWIDAHDDLYLPGLQPYGLNAGNLLFASGIAGDRATLWALEEALSASGLAAVAAVLERPSFTALRRMSLIAREHGTTAFLMRAEGPLGASPSVSRWHVAAAPSPAGGVPGVGATAWRLTLAKHRYGIEHLSFLVTDGKEGWRAESRQETSPPLAATG
jgi:protein ImuA